MEKRRIMTLLAVLFLMVGGALAQTKVNGTVVSQDDGEPVIGASIIVVGTNVGTVTNASGQFSLTCPAGKNVLRITYVGMEPLELTARPNMRILLTSDQTALDEVIVVAYGTAKKSAFTGSAAVLSTEDLSKHTVANVTDALVGSVPGLQIRGASGAPGSGSGSINIRGIASMYAGTDPLVIVDGAPYSASLTNIPVEDIESVSVLKDAASAALYGARGAAGVIIVTTKKGKSRDAQITVDAKWGSNSRAIPDYDVIKNPAQYYEVFYNQLDNYARNVGGMDANAANAWANKTMLDQLGYNVYAIPEGQNLVGTNGKLNPNATLGRAYNWNGETYYMAPDDWTDIAYNNSLRQEYTVSANAANDRGSFYASLGFLDEDGIIQFSGYQRTTARLKADYQLKPWLKMAANIGYVHSKTISNPNLTSDSYGSTNMFYYTSRIAPIYPAYVRIIDPVTKQPIIRTDDNGNIQYDYGVAATNYGVGRGFLQTGNPLGSNNYNKIYTWGNQLHGNYVLDAQITKHLKATLNSTLTFGQTSYSDYENALYGPKVGVNGQIVKNQSNTLRQNHIQTLNYANLFGKHELTVLAGHEWYDTKTRYLYAERTGGFSADIPEINAFATMSGSNSYTTEYNVEGYFGNLQYNYDNKYFGSASFRRDATSYFAKKNRWGSFWSVGGAWIISKESFMESTADWLDQLKLKASIGQQGNDNIGSWAYIDLYSLSKATDTQMTPTFSRIGNPEITWETTTNFNAGLEWSLWKGRLTGSFDVYNKKITDLLFWLSVPESAGSRGYYGNIGDMRNTGVELVISGDVIRTKDLTWNITANLSHNSTKITKLPETKIADNGGFYESSYWYAVDGPMYNYMTYSYAGVYNENTYKLTGDEKFDQSKAGLALYWYDKNLTTKKDPTTGEYYADANGKPLNPNATLNEETGKWEGVTNVVNKPGSEKTGATTDIGEAQRYVDGSILPKVFGGFSTTLRYKGIDVSASFDYQLGGKVYDSQYRGLVVPGTSASDAGSTFHKDVLNAYSPTNTGSDFPRWQYGDNYAAYGSDRFLTSASYLNFQSFTVGYTLPKSLISKIGMQSIRVYCSGENLYFWSKRKGFDPRQSYDAVKSINTYSPVRTISGGIQLTF